MKITIVIAGLLLAPFAFTQDQSAGPARELSIVTPGSSSTAPPSKTWPSFEVFTGFSEINVDNKQDLTSVPRKWAGGWETSVAYNFSRHWAMEADATGYYTHYNNVAVPVPNDIQNDSRLINIRAHGYGFGVTPRLNIRPMFLHAGLGYSHTSNDGPQFSISETDWAFIMGGGAEFRVTNHFAVRSSADWLYTNSHNAPPRDHYRVSVGPVFTFGGRLKRDPRWLNLAGGRVL